MTLTVFSSSTTETEGLSLDTKTQKYKQKHVQLITYQLCTAVSHTQMYADATYTQFLKCKLGLAHTQMSWVLGLHTTKETQVKSLPAVHPIKQKSVCEREATPHWLAEAPAWGGRQFHVMPSRCKKKKKKRRRRSWESKPYPCSLMTWV